MLRRNFKSFGAEPVTTQTKADERLNNLVADYLNKIAFVLVYSTSDGVLTSIPVMNNDLCTDDSYYGEQQFENLKIWTRRKR